MPGGLDPYAAVTTASRGTLDSVNMVNIHGTQMIQPGRKNDDTTTAAVMEKIGRSPGLQVGDLPDSKLPAQLGPGSDPGALAAGAQGNTLTGLPGLPNDVPAKSTSQWKQKWCCLVDDCFTPRKQPSEQNSRMPLTCKEHSGALVVLYGRVASRECRACRTFHPITAFDRDNKTCETRLLRKKLRYRARTMQRRGMQPENLTNPTVAHPYPGGSYHLPGSRYRVTSAVWAAWAVSARRRRATV